MSIEKLIKPVEIKYKNSGLSPEGLEIWELEDEYSLTEEQRNNIEEIEHFDLESYGEMGVDYFGCESGYIELKEGIFHFDFEKLEFNIIKLYITGEDKERFLQEDYRELIEHWEEVYYNNFDEYEEDIEQFKTFDEYFK
ncbi:MAG: hypothetical protein LLF98_02405 [Clostridium sp.]|uniref:hypothetical protein n=1 Tax=Clostridium sp. TaxID=1506 RepID=UPI0025C34FCC|nr:hypothetical protein [Clostridium sp.]MCE5220134.1 hypothetical protein [Clostridium sp.]